MCFHCRVGVSIFHPLLLILYWLTVFGFFSDGYSIWDSCHLTHGFPHEWFDISCNVLVRGHFYLEKPILFSRRMSFRHILNVLIFHSLFMKLWWICFSTFFFVGQIGHCECTGVSCNYSPHVPFEFRESVIIFKVDGFLMCFRRFVFPFYALFMCDVNSRWPPHLVLLLLFSTFFSAGGIICYV